jgi:hypothetical protein
MRAIKEVLQIIYGALQDAWADIWTVLVCNLAWTLSVILIIPGPPATLALFTYCNRLAHGEIADFSDYWRAFRRHWGPAWRWAAVNLLVVGLLIGDFILTGQLSQSSFARFMQGFYLAALGAWLIVQLYALPFMIEQTTPSVRQALRNGGVMLGRNLSFSVILSILLVMLLVVGAALFMLTLACGGVVVASAGNRAVINRLEAHRQPPSTKQ